MKGAAREPGHSQEPWRRTSEWLRPIPKSSRVKGLFLWDTLLPRNTANQRSPGRSEVCAPSYALGSHVQVPSDLRTKGAGQVP